MAAPQVEEVQPVLFNQSAGENVLEIVRVAGRCFVLQHIGDRARVTQIHRSDRVAPAYGSGTVVPFPARGR
jgi:hypothetical protein